MSRLRLLVPAPSLRRSTALLLVLLFAALTVASPSAGPAHATDGYEPDPQVLADVQSYARETQHGYDHVLRWMRVLRAFGVVEDMTAAEAQDNAGNYSAARWDPVVEELKKLEAPASEPESAPEPQANRAPQVDTGAADYARFVSSGPAPRGVLVSKPFAGVFSDPDGDQLTYSLSAFEGPLQLLDQLMIHPDGGSDASVAESGRPVQAVMRVFFEADADDDWDAMAPPVPDVPVVTVTLTATDPDGLSASVQGSFEIRWERQADESACELSAPSSVSGIGIERAAVISWTLPRNLDDACEVSGFVVGASGASGVRLEDRITDPEARRHVMRGLDPGDYHFSVRIVYAEGTSEEFVTLRQQNVPAACDIVVTAEPYAANMISGRWRTNHTAPTGCVWGPTIEFQYKRTQDDFYQTYGRFPNWPQRDPDLPAFIIGGMEPYVSYDFKIVAVNAAGERGESNVATAMIVTGDPSVAADANSPLNLRVSANNSSGAYVTWDQPGSFGAGRSFNAWVLEWTRLDEDGNAAATETTSLTGLADTEHIIDNLVDGERYVVRAAARTTDSANNAHDAWSVPAPPVTAWSEPLQAWLHNSVHGTVFHISNRLWFSSSANKTVAIATCQANTESNQCPPGDLVSLPVDGQITVSLEVTGIDAGAQPVTLTVQDGEAGGPRAPRIAASGGNTQISVDWTDVDADDDLDRYIGTVDAYVVQHRQGTSGTWTDTVFTDTTKRSHVITGLTNGSDYQVRVRGRSANLEDHDDDPVTDDETVHRLGFTSEIVTVRTHILRNLLPHWPEDVRITAGAASLIVEWEQPKQDDRRSVTHAYQVRHRLRGSSDDWTESEVILPLPTHRMCDRDAYACVNPRRYEITGLTPGQDYAVAIRAKNAHGWGYWLELGGANYPNN